MTKKATLNFDPLYELGFSESEVSVYLAMIDHGALTAQEIVRYTQGKRPTVYYALRQLEEKGLIHKTGTQAVERFQAEPPVKLLAVVLLRQHRLRTLEDEVKKIIPQLTPSKTSREGIPKILFYEGEENMKQIISETLYCRSKKIDYLTPHDNFFWQTDKTFANTYIHDRREWGIKTRHLWEAPLAPNYMVNFRQHADVRILPKQMYGKYRTTMLLFDDTVMYISSRDSGYVLVVKSKEHYELMASMYETLWGLSKKM